MEDGGFCADASDSRKRPLDCDSDHSMKKRSNFGQGKDVLLKQLIPSQLAGVILGKGGETIIQIQSLTGSVIKMSKGADYYPGTTDRVCVINGSPNNVRNAHQAIWEKIHARRDIAAKLGGEEPKMKIVVPNATVGMIIGKGGCYIKQIKDDSDAYVQISQKAPDTLLVERVVTIGGTMDQMIQAFEMVFKMIVDDPQSSSCPYVSYADFKGPIANANPIGSPFAVSAGPMMDSGGFPGPPNVPVGGNFHGSNAPALEMLKSTLMNSGFSVQASDEITAAICTLASYGLLDAGAGLTGSGFAPGPGHCGLTLEYLSGILSGTPNRRPMPGPPGGGMMGPPKPEKFGGPGGRFQGTGNGSDVFRGGPFGEMANQNSFGLRSGPEHPGNGPGMMSPDESMDDGTMSEDLQIGENIVGAVLGHGGRAIVEIQRITSATIQISKKGVFAPGTRNRIATISGNPSAVKRAVFMVRQCIQQEENKRIRQEQMQQSF